MMDGNGTQPSLNDLVAAMEAAGIYVAVSVRDGALVLEGEVDTEESRQAALDLAAVVAAPAGLTVEDAMEVLEIDLELGSPDRGEVDVTTLSPMDASTLTEGGTIDPNLAAEEAIPYFPATDPVIGEQRPEQDEVEVIGGFQPTADAGDEERAPSGRLHDDERISDKVRQELKQDAATTDLAEIYVSTMGGVVHLHGQVPTLEDADNAEAVAARVPGVVEVREELRVLTMKAD